MASTPHRAAVSTVSSSEYRHGRRRVILILRESGTRVYVATATNITLSALRKIQCARPGPTDMEDCILFRFLWFTQSKCDTNQHYLILQLQCMDIVESFLTMVRCCGWKAIETTASVCV